MTPIGYAITPVAVHAHGRAGSTQTSRLPTGTKPGLIKPDVCAPGSSTDTCNWRFSESGKPYIPFSGTSSATPHVAGCLALLAEACLISGNPIVPERIQEALENTAVRIQGQVRDKQNNFGAGRVDVFAAFKYGKDRGWWDAPQN